ncbi:hypothetical protein KCU93_g3095, partial [Aureobasidium melanogenum]
MNKEFCILLDEQTVQDKNSANRERANLLLFPTHTKQRGSNTVISMPSSSKRESKTYSSRDSHVVTHRSTNLPFNCLCMAERTGCPVFS